MTSSGSTWKQTPAASRALWIVGVLAITSGWLLDWADTWEGLAAIIGPLGILAILVGLALDVRSRSRRRG